MKWSSNKDLDQLICALERQGAVVERTRNNHVRVTAPGVPPVIMGCTPSGVNLRKMRSQLKHVIRVLDPASSA